MSSKIYDVLEWRVSTVYNLWDIVKRTADTPKPTEVYYYCRIPHTSDAVSFDATKWGGRSTWNNAYYKPEFIWMPNYNSSMDFEPKVKSIKMGDGYEQRTPDGINNSLLKFNLNFNGRPLHEATAIIHFLKVRGGAESFVFTPYAPFGKTKLFKCPNYSVNFEFFNNYAISAVFEEVVN